MLASSVLKDTIANFNNICDSSLLEPQTVFTSYRKSHHDRKRRKMTRYQLNNCLISAISWDKTRNCQNELSISSKGYRYSSRRLTRVISK